MHYLRKKICHRLRGRQKILSRGWLTSLRLAQPAQVFVGPVSLLLGVNRLKVVLSVWQMNPMCETAQGVKVFWRSRQQSALACRHAPVSGETRQTRQISAETADPLTQHKEGEGTN